MIDKTSNALHSARMTGQDRDATLLDRLRFQGRASVGDLASSLGVSASTVRRDLRRLEREGNVMRTHGGATVSLGPWKANGGEMSVTKRRIAELAATLVVDGQTIVIGSGSTAAAFALRLVDRSLTVITNALDVANLLVDRPGIELIILGGVVRPQIHSMLGHLAELPRRSCAQTRSSWASALSASSKFDERLVPEILTTARSVAWLHQSWLLADSSKFDRVAPGFVFGLDKVDTLVTDARVNPATVRTSKQQASAFSSRRARRARVSRASENSLGRICQPGWRAAARTSSHRATGSRFACSPMPCVSTGPACPVLGVVSDFREATGWGVDGGQPTRE